jgi:hypothetical protein
MRHTTILAALPGYIGAPFSDTPRLREERWFSLWEITDHIAADLAKVFRLLNEKEETDALAALMRLDFAGLSEVMVVFTWLAKSAERNAVSDSNLFPVLEKVIANLGARRANKHAEALINAVSRRFSEITDVNIIFTCFLVTPIGKRYHSAVKQPSESAASLETMWKKGVVTLTKMFYCDVAQMISILQDFLDNPRQFGALKDLCTNWPWLVFIANQQLDTGSFINFMKRIEAFPATECACERLFCQLRNSVGAVRHQMSDSMTFDLLVIKTRIMWPSATQIKECAEILREVQSDTGPDQTAI